MTISFTKKHRPLKFLDLISQDEIKKILQNIVKDQICVSSFLFHGDRGCGKTSMARIFACALNCEKLNQNDFEPCGICGSCKSIQVQTNLDVLEIDAASNNSVENIRLLIENSKYLPQNSKRKIYILDEAHMLSLSAFNALLKILEEPPKYVTFILITTEYRKIPLTVLSRCLRLQFKKLDRKQISEFLENICHFENIIFEKNALQTIADLSEGAVRDSLSLLESASILTGKKINGESLQEIFGVLNEKKDLFEIFQNIVLNELEKNAFFKIKKFLRDGIDANFFLQSMTTLVSEIIFFKKIYNLEEDLISLKKADFSNFQILSFVETEKICDFLTKFSKSLNFANLFEILEILNQSFEIFRNNIYQNQENFLKITIIKLSLIFISQDLKKENQFQQKEKDLKNFDNSDQNQIFLPVNPDILIFDKKIEELHSKNSSDSNENELKNSSDSNENELRNSLIQILKKNQEFFISDMVSNEKIKINFEEFFILDDCLTPSKYLLYILKILRSNFDTKWRILLKENLNEKNSTQENKNFKHKSLTKENFEDKKANHQIKLTDSNFSNKRIEIKSSSEIKNNFLESKFFFEMKKVFKISENNIRILK